MKTRILSQAQIRELITMDRAVTAVENAFVEAGGEAVAIEEACACDIVCTATPSRSPVVRRDWIRAGAHINAMGADAPGRRSSTRRSSPARS